jgi:gag-polyprotein putative aspartyl protease
MHGTLEELRNHHPGKWLLIELDDSEAEEGTILVAHQDPEMVDKEMEKVSQLKMIRRKPLYMTYSIPEGQELSAFAL